MHKTLGLIISKKENERKYRVTVPLLFPLHSPIPSFRLYKQITYNLKRAFDKLNAQRLLSD
jgi:hypothetical protein